MGWESRKRGGRYYYRARREEGRVKKEYLGCGHRAIKAAREDRDRHAERALDRQRLREFDSSLWPISQRMRINHDFCRLVYHGVHLASGFKLTPNYNWRRRTDWNMVTSMATTAQASDPSPAGQQRTLGDVVELIKRGRTDLIGDLRRVLQSSPELAKMEGISQRTQLAWAGLLAGGDVLRREIFLVQADQLRSDLVGNDATAGEKLMADRVISLQQQVCYFEQLEAANVVDFAGSKIGQAISARQEKANRQLTAAIQQLGVVQKLQTEIQPRKPAIALRIYAPDRQRKTA